MTLNELNAAIIKWAEDREITKHSTSYAQAFKTAEEEQELIEAVQSHKLRREGMVETDLPIFDAIGDIYVTLVVGMACCQTELRDINCLSHQGASGQKDPVSQLQRELIPLSRHTPKDKGDSVTVFYYSTVGLMMSNLANVAEQYGTTLEACVEQAYNVIKDRKGRLLPNGIFVKEGRWT